MKPPESSSPSSSAKGDDESQEAGGVTIPEDFQKKCASFLSECDDQDCLDYLSQAISKKRMEMSKEENDEMMDTEGMPSE